MEIKISLTTKARSNMPKIIVVTSGKGGVGKTTTSASLATGIALLGYKTIAIDFDVGLKNLDLLMGVERRVVYNFIDVIRGGVRLNQAIIRDKAIENLYTLAASQTWDKDVLTQEGVEKVLNELKEMGFQYIICDSPAGIERGALMALYFADEAIITTNPEVSSIRDSDRILGILSSKSRRAELGEEPVKEHLVITRYDPRRVRIKDMLSVEDVIDVLGVELLGVIPESNDVLLASNEGMPVILKRDTIAGQAYSDLVERLLGNTSLPHRFLEDKTNFIYKIFGLKKL
ncbi:septum site-determining protein MinD [Dichelobacter nodosus]